LLALTYLEKLQNRSIALKISSLVNLIESGAGMIFLMSWWASIMSIDPTCIFELSNFLHSASNFFPYSKNLLHSSCYFLGYSFSYPFQCVITSFVNFKAFFLLSTYLFSGWPSSPQPYSENLENSYEINF
jgi:hypothetical protein